MKVSTDIHAGASVTDAVQTVGGQLNQFVSAAQEQAVALTDSVAGVFTGFWEPSPQRFSINRRAADGSQAGNRLSQRRLVRQPVALMMTSVTF